ncbi:MAG TPA: DUF58 domain-containing protein [Polyangiaceae bacterium]|nr:DUF58 domain-containing protein [Polyangiaceae bacterium]
MKQSFRGAIDWSKLAPLRLRARLVAEGAWAGMHPSPRRGAGVEFGGHRAYTPGDDLRFIDRHALMRHGELMIREFETETDRDLRLLVDATPSMTYQSARGPVSKLGYAALIAAALAKITVDTGDRVGLDWLGGKEMRPLPAMGGGEAFERVANLLEDAQAEALSERDVDKALAAAERSRRGTIVVLLSDLLDLPDAAIERVTALGAHRRVVIALQVLDPEELDFSFAGPVRLKSLEDGTIVDTDADAVRQGYLEAMARLRTTWEKRLSARGGRLVSAVTTEDPVGVVVRALRAIAGGRT